MRGVKLVLGLGLGALFGAGLTGCGDSRGAQGGTAVYKCDKCGKTSSSSGECCGAAMKKSAEGSGRREGS